MASNTSASPAQCHPALLIRPKQIQLDLSLVRDRRIGRPVGLLAEDEFGFGCIILPPVQPHIEPHGPARVVSVGQGYRIRLHRAIDRRIIGMDLLLALVPVALPGGHLPPAIDALVQHHHGVIDGVLGVHQLGKLQQETSGFGVHLDVAHQVGIGMMRLQFPDQRFDPLALLTDLRQLLGLRLNRRRATPLRAHGQSHTQQNGQYGPLFHSGEHIKPGPRFDTRGAPTMSKCNLWTSPGEVRYRTSRKADFKEAGMAVTIPIEPLACAPASKLLRR